MKKRRTAIIAFLLCACLAIGAGFAALATDLTAIGTIKVHTDAAEETFKNDISFKSGTKVSDKDSITVTEGTRAATFTVASLANQGDSAVFTFEVQNKGDYDATVSVASVVFTTDNVTTTEGTAVSNNNFTVSYEWVDGDSTLAAIEGTTVDTATLRVTVTLNQLVTEAINETVTITITATTV